MERTQFFLEACGTVAAGTNQSVPLLTDKVDPRVPQYCVVECNCFFCPAGPKMLDGVLKAFVEPVIWSIVVWLCPDGRMQGQEVGRNIFVVHKG